MGEAILDKGHQSIIENESNRQKVIIVQSSFRFSKPPSFDFPGRSLVNKSNYCAYQGIYIKAR
jgi:hypothetical protein